jgi:hypothetical protein
MTNILTMTMYRYRGQFVIILLYFSKRRTDQMTNILTITMCRGNCVNILLYISARGGQIR